MSNEVIELDGALLTEENAHGYLKEMLHFPDYYGKNMDALFDCLTELPEMEIRIKDFYVEGYFQIRLKRVFQAAVRANRQLIIRFV